MRVGYLADRKDFFFVHGCYGYAIVDLLKEMKVFLDNNPKEVLIVDFNHFYSFTDEIHKAKNGLLDSVEETINNDYSQWMTNLPVTLTTIPLNQLAIPGSHDSGAYYLDPKSPVCPGNLFIN